MIEGWNRFVVESPIDNISSLESVRNDTANIESSQIK